MSEGVDRAISEFEKRIKHSYPAIEQYKDKIIEIYKMIGNFQKDYEIEIKYKNLLVHQCKQSIKRYQKWIERKETDIEDYKEALKKLKE